MSQVIAPHGIGEQTVMTDPMEALRQDVYQEATDKLIGAQGHGFVAHTVFGSVVLPLEGHATFIMGDKSMVGDGDAVGITRQISQHGLGSGKRSLRIEVPVRVLERC